MTRATDVLLVDDDPDALESIGSELRASGYEVRTAPDAASAWESFRARRPDLVISDIRMPGATGIDLLRRIRVVSDVAVILLTARADLALAVSALREGATDFVRFPEEAPELLARARQWLPARASREPEDAAAGLLAGESEPMEELRGRVRSLAQLEVSVLVSGEPGTGRMRTARAIHALSGNPIPLRAVGAPHYALPSAPCATVLVDLERWPQAAQDRWSAALRGQPERSGRLYAIGSPELAACVERGELRRDLWLRLSRFRVEVPPLRARAVEMPRLARAALAEVAAAHGRRGYSLTHGALDALRRRPWRGNFPELYAVLEQALAFAVGARLGRDEIERAVEAVIASREDSLESRRAARQSAEREQLVRLLGTCRGNVAEVARQLGMTRGAVTYRLRKHGLAR
jgi:DNA-binding NtrC family response regulator